MNNSHRLITALVATGALLIGSAISSSAVANGKEDKGEGKIVPAAVPRTGQTTCYDSGGNQIDCPGTGQDGDKLAGVAAPTPRFVDKRNGTVTDKLTGLIWLKNANCFGAVDWQTALNRANNLKGDAQQCNLTDNSTAGQWRLPNVKELQSLINLWVLWSCPEQQSG